MPDPSRDPERKMAEAKGKQQLAKMKFENDAQRRDYEKSVKANDQNVMGIPPFFPPTVIRSSGFFSLKRDCQKQGHRWSNTMDAWCLDCEVDKPQTEPQAQEV
jgi:hypothetical protein